MLIRPRHDELNAGATPNGDFANPTHGDQCAGRVIGLDPLADA